MTREEAIAILDGFKHNPLFNEQHFEALDMAISALSENEGEWILDETDNSVECNKCLCQIYPNDIFYGDAHFCPNCGAKMIGGE